MRPVTIFGVIACVIVIGFTLIYFQVVSASPHWDSLSPWAPWPPMVLPAHEGVDYIKPRALPTIAAPIVVAPGEMLGYTTIYDFEVHYATADELYVVPGDEYLDVIHNPGQGTSRAATARFDEYAGDIYLPAGSTLLGIFLQFAKGNGEDHCVASWDLFTDIQVNNGPWMLRNVLAYDNMDFGEFRVLDRHSEVCSSGWAFWVYPGLFDRNRDTLRVRFDARGWVVFPPSVPD